MSVVGYDNAGVDGAPSPSIFGDCPKTLLNDKGLGRFVDTNFAGDVLTLPGLRNANTNGTYAYLADYPGCLITLGGADNDAATMFTAPLGKIVKNSGHKFWFETEIAPTIITDEWGMFVGIAEVTACTSELVVDDVASLITESMIGFRKLAASNTISAVYAKDDGTPVVVKADVGVTLVASTAVKLGISFNGYDIISFFVDGVKVASQTVDGTIDQDTNMCGVFSIKAGHANAILSMCRFFRAAFQERS